jgi:hypothetical protein
MSALREGVSVESQAVAPTAHPGRANWVSYACCARMRSLQGDYLKNNGNSPYDVHCGASLPETIVVSRLPPVSFYAYTGPLLLSGEAAAQGSRLRSLTSVPVGVV